MSAHTPGEWVGFVTHHSCEVRVKDTSTVLADVYFGGGGVALPDGQAEANARLMAAAPDLLAACRSALLVVGGIAGANKIARQCQAAIAKATGA